ncbi:MAG TPA: DUF4242 domain-containing protein [Puia sp.]|jgi:hypothetical protein
MKTSSFTTAFVAACLLSSHLSAQTTEMDTTKSKNHLYIDVHHLEPGKVTYAAVEEAHQKDLAAEKQYGVSFIKFWVDEKEGNVYCLSSAPDSESIRKTHAAAHGLLPEQVYQVTSGTPASYTGKDFFLDVHELGAGNVKAKDVAAAHQKDLAVQKKYGVSFINYWVDEKDGRVICLSQAPDSAAVVATHKEAHGLIPVSVEKVKQGD